ncbi:DUF2239 family protein [Agrobacterium pusense]|uniref:DUF2239 family protein n=1 Tax=Agrobacterium pusense TaxID=648995 RepID=UPI001C6E77C1|nr:DUF2239 family protein [Agrobacterium pusense]MBW9071282.1 DUF2239 family protein [Agrobacterium pusense]MBW9084343.1 DUF2239 family protein [Agrobacterium pusense]MBW9124055.1 DUF2239 family protein [Agrobacterium pusense]MBW9137241.1 DUF2239 family protein [Agrobacterium pusense]
MSDPAAETFTAFVGKRLLLSGPLSEVAFVAKRSPDEVGAVLVFDDTTGRPIDLDLRGTDAEVLERLLPQKAYPARYRTKAETATGSADSEETHSKALRGRPKLGVVAREVTLLPRQWEWLAEQSGGASATLRRLVEEARKGAALRQQWQAAQDAAYQFMHAIAGDLHGYEEATRALFADDRPALKKRVAAWPEDIRTYALRLAFGADDDQSA